MATTVTNGVLKRDRRANLKLGMVDSSGTQPVIASVRLRTRVVRRGLWQQPKYCQQPFRCDKNLSVRYQRSRPLRRKIEGVSRPRRLIAVVQFGGKIGRIKTVKNSWSSSAVA